MIVITIPRHIPKFVRAAGPTLAATRAAIPAASGVTAASGGSLLPVVAGVLAVSVVAAGVVALIAALARGSRFTQVPGTGEMEPSWIGDWAAASAPYLLDDQTGQDWVTGRLPTVRTAGVRLTVTARLRFPDQFNPGRFVTITSGWDADFSNLKRLYIERSTTQNGQPGNYVSSVAVLHDGSRIVRGGLSVGPATTIIIDSVVLSPLDPSDPGVPYPPQQPASDVLRWRSSVSPSPLSGQDLASFTGVPLAGSYLRLPRVTTGAAASYARPGEVDGPDLAPQWIPSRRVAPLTPTLPGTVPLDRGFRPTPVRPLAPVRVEPNLYQPWPGADPVGDPMWRPAPTMEGLAVEVGRQEQKLNQIGRMIARRGPEASIESLRDWLEENLPDSGGPSGGNVILPPVTYVFTPPHQTAPSGSDLAQTISIGSGPALVKLAARIDALAVAIQIQSRWRVKLSKGNAPAANVTIAAQGVEEES